MLRASSTPRPAALLTALLSLLAPACGDSGSASDGLSAGSLCEPAAQPSCAEGCAASCVDGAWQCDCGEGTTGSAGTGASTTENSDDSTSSSGDASSTTGDASTTSDDATDSATTGEASTTADTSTTGDATDGVTTGEDSTGTTTGTTGEMTGTTTTDPWEPAQHVHIYIDNFCKVTVDPPEITVPVDEIAKLSYHNHSVDYLADVWMSYGGGFLDLELGATWDEKFEWCAGPNPSTGWADISIAGGGNNACPKHRMYIYCE
ncbi:MAG: hypothetical protein R3A79_11775 [Nannocystaceae bacterium]